MDKANIECPCYSVVEAYTKEYFQATCLLNRSAQSERQKEGDYSVVLLTLHQCV